MSVFNSNKIACVCLRCFDAVSWAAGRADLHTAQLMPLPVPLTVCCFSKIQIAFTFLVPVDLGSRGKRAAKTCVVVVISKLTCGNCKTMQCSSVVSRLVTFCSVCLLADFLVVVTCCWVIMVLLTSATYIFVML